MTEATTQVGLSVPQQDEMECELIKLVNATWKTFVNKNGIFRAWHPYHGQVEARSMIELDERVRKATSTGRVKVHIPYMRFVKSGIRGNYRWRAVRGVATGLHGGTGNVLYEEGRGSQQLSGYSFSEYLRPLDGADEAEMLRLLVARDELDDQLTALRGRYAFPDGLKAEVKNQVNAVNGDRES